MGNQVLQDAGQRMSQLRKTVEEMLRERRAAESNIGRNPTEDESTEESPFWRTSATRPLVWVTTDNATCEDRIACLEAQIASITNRGGQLKIGSCNAAKLCRDQRDSKNQDEATLSPSESV